MPTVPRQLNHGWKFWHNHLSRIVFSLVIIFCKVLQRIWVDHTISLIASIRILFCFLNFGEIAADILLIAISPSTTHLSVGWEIAVLSTFVIVIVAVLIVVVWQSTRERTDPRDVELEDGARSGSNWPASLINTRKKKRRRKKARKTRARDPDMTSKEIDSKNEEFEEVESFEEDTTPL